MKRFGKLLRDQSGLGTIEYALIASLISVAAIAGYDSLGDEVQASLSNTQQTVADNI